VRGAGLEFRRVDAGGAFGRTAEPDYLAMNPNGRVPTLVEADGFALWESNTICRYLAAGHASLHPGLHPAEPRARALVERWMDWQLGHLNGPMTTILFTLYRTPETDRDHAALARAREDAQRLWDMADSALGEAPWLGGDALSLADIALGPFLHRWLHMPIERRPQPRLAAWHGRMMGRPGFARHVAVPIT
jgi:glutathione S-transferase